LNTDCNSGRIELQGPGNRTIVADFNGGTITSDGGALLLQEADRKSRLIKRLAKCFLDARDPSRTEHTVEELLRQRILAIALGYEDLDDHDQLRVDPLLATVVGKIDVTGESRARERDRGAALAGKSTLCRLDHALKDFTEPKSGQAEPDNEPQAEPDDEPRAEDRYHKITADREAIERFFVETFLDAFEEMPERIVLDFDATDNLIHGEQEGRFYHGYYGHYCYLPLYVFCERYVLCAKLRPSNIDAAEGSLEVLQDLVAAIRERWPEVEILVRADSGFTRDAFMTWCDENRVDYVLGLAKNSRLREMLEPAFETLEKALEESEESKGREFAELRYKTRTSWSRERRVVGKAEITVGGRNPRFVVTSLSEEEIAAKPLYEDLYCARGEMENRIKEQQLDLFSSRTSSHWMRANQMRLWFSAVAHLLFEEIRRLSLEETELATARCETIRLKLFKIGTLVRVTVRKIWFSFSSAYAYRKLFSRILRRLRGPDPSPA